ncbi:MAG: hypothetical protein LC620_04440, partial [Halobacteriales archaeon]|nr:hypothetical protein [Halobacteriales archaeon]
RLSNSPTNPDSHWGVAFFPFEQPVPVHRGARIAVELKILANGGVWQWRANVNGRTFEHETPSGFQQGTGVPHKIARDRTPQLTPPGHLELVILSLLDGTRSISEVERTLLTRYTDLVQSREVASHLVREAVLKYT